MAGAGPLSPAELAERTGTAERYVREWLAAQAAAGYVAYDPASGRFSLHEEQAFALADPAGPVYLPGAFQLALASLKGEPRIAEAFRTGAGVGWHEQDPEVFDGCEMFFAPGYRANLVQSWIPALDGVEAKLQAGARVADVGCGHGASTIILAKAYPNSTFTGFDYHQRSIDWARKAASEAGVSDRVRFEVAAADAFAGDGYDLVAAFDCFHDMATPPGRPPTSAAPSPTTAPGCWSSRPPATARRTTSTRSGGCTTASRSCCACPTPSPSSPRPSLATRPARPAPAS
jgi:Methyltransferase domain